MLALLILANMTLLMSRSAQNVNVTELHNCHHRLAKLFNRTQLKVAKDFEPFRKEMVPVFTHIVQERDFHCHNNNNTNK